MSDVREAVGIVVMVVGVALLIVTALVDLPGLRPQRGAAARMAAVCYVVAFAAMLGGGWLSSRSQ